MFLLSILLSTAPVSQGNMDAANRCMREKPLAYATRPETAEALAWLIASECAELLPQSEKDCGEIQYRCDAITEETNASIQAEMRRFAYRIIVVLRNPPKPAATPMPRDPIGSASTPQRLAAVRSIDKPQSDDPGDDEYSYGFRLWEARFYSEAQEQLKLMINRYPSHDRISYARNLLGRAYLDEGKPRDAAIWFLQNYQKGKTGERAPDSLLNLVEAMRQQKDMRRACIALAELTSTYPREIAGRLQAQYIAAKSGVKCN